MKNDYIVMKVEDLKQLLNDVKSYKSYQVFDSDQNRDGQGEWHCDIEISNEPLGEDSWGDGEEHWSFDSLENHIAKFGERQGEIQDALLSLTRASLSPSSSSASEQKPAHLQERLELTADMFDDFYRNAQELVDDLKGDENEQD